MSRSRNAPAATPPAVGRERAAGAGGGGPADHRPASTANKAGPQTGDFVAGAGGGGILVYCAQHFIPEPSISQAAVYVCPALSMFFVGLYQKVSKIALNQFDYFVADKERKRLLKKSDEDIEDCKKKLAALDADPRASEQHKAKMRKHLEALEEFHFELRLKGSVTFMSAEP